LPNLDQGVAHKQVIGESPESKGKYSTPHRATALDTLLLVEDQHDSNAHDISKYQIHPF